MSRILKEVAKSSPNRTTIVAVGTVYSMEGDFAPLTDIVDLTDLIFPHNNAHLVVGEAHATGVSGPNGSGRVCELGVENRIPIRLHSLGKALAWNMPRQSVKRWTLQHNRSWKSCEAALRENTTGYGVAKRTKMKDTDHETTTGEVEKAVRVEKRRIPKGRRPIKARNLRVTRLLGKREKNDSKHSQQ